MTVEESIKNAYESQGWPVLSVVFATDGSYNVSFLTIEGVITRNIVLLYAVRNDTINQCKRHTPVPNN